MDRSPPSFFNQGPSAHARLAFFALLAIALLVVDARMGTLAALRQGIGTVLYPLQRTLLVPRDLLRLGADYFGDVDRLRTENAELKRLEIANARALLRAEHLAAENAQLRALLGARERIAIPSVMAGVLAGQPVIDARGIAGQVTRVLPLSAEVTLLTDRNATIPVEISRTGQRSIAFGGAAPGLLVTSEVAYPAWKAYIDGKPVEIATAFGLLRAVEFPAGTHVVDFRFESPNEVWGMALTVAAIVASGALLAWSRMEGK